MKLKHTRLCGRKPRSPTRSLRQRRTGAKTGDYAQNYTHLIGSEGVTNERPNRYDLEEREEPLHGHRLAADPGNAIARRNAGPH